MESTLKNMVLSLLGVTFAASLSVGIVNMITEEPIRIAQAQATESALKKVVPAFHRRTVQSVEVDGLEVDVYTLSGTRAEIVAYAVRTQSKAGYSGTITMMVGVLPSGKLYDVSILSHSETPGLGSKMCDDENSLIKSVKNRSLDSLDLRVTKDGGDVDALSGATITSRAYGDAISRAYRAIQVVGVARYGGESTAKAAAATAQQERKEAEAAETQKQRMEQLMLQAKQNQAKDVALREEVEERGYVVDSVMLRHIMRQLSYERYDWFIKSMEQEYRSDKEIKRRSAQLAAIAAQRIKENESRE